MLSVFYLHSPVSLSRCLPSSCASPVSLNPSGMRPVCVFFTLQIQIISSFSFFCVSVPFPMVTCWQWICWFHLPTAGELIDLQPLECSYSSLSEKWICFPPLPHLQVPTISALTTVPYLFSLIFTHLPVIFQSSWLLLHSFPYKFMLIQ